MSVSVVRSHGVEDRSAYDIPSSLLPSLKDVLNEMVECEEWEEGDFRRIQSLLEKVKIGQKPDYEEFDLFLNEVVKPKSSVEKSFVKYEEIIKEAINKLFPEEVELARLSSDGSVEIGSPLHRLRETYLSGLLLKK